MKKLLLILLLFLSFNGSSYADFESWFIASNTCQKINNLEEDIQELSKQTAIVSKENELQDIQIKEIKKKANNPLAK